MLLAFVKNTEILAFDNEAERGEGIFAAGVCEGPCTVRDDKACSNQAVAANHNKTTGGGAWVRTTVYATVFISGITKRHRWPGSGLTWLITSPCTAGIIAFVGVSCQTEHRRNSNEADQDQ